MRPTVLVLLTVTLLVVTAHGLPAQDASEAPLEAFGALVVGEWIDGDGGRHLLEWTLGRQAIRSRSWGPGPDGGRLVSEGLWYEVSGSRAEGNGAVGGLVVAREMGIDRFEYRSTVAGDTVRHHLTTHGAMAGRFLETWRFEEGAYRWTLHAVDAEGSPVGDPILEGRYERSGPGGG